MLRFCFACIGFCALITSSHANEDVDKTTYYKVTYVYDGDTVKLRPIGASHVSSEFKLRLSDIDAPERNQNYGIKSRRALIKLCQGKNIKATAQISGTDKYQRSLGKLQCNGIDASYYQTEHGLAWFYSKYSKDANLYQAAQNAKKLTLGLWADKNPTAPWHWRRSHLH